MSFILPPRQGGSSSQHRPPRRNATLPVSSTRSHSSPPQTAPPTQPSRIPSISRAGNENGGIRSDSHRSSSAHPLQAEINRLMASCEDHELKIRSAKATIEHRLFSELPAMLSKLNETDERAEQIASQISVSLQSNLHPLQSRLDNLVLARRNDVETMKERTTPWKDLSSSTNGTAGEKDKGSGRIQRMTGISATDGLGRIEKWAEEVEMYLTSEIIRLKAQVTSLSWRKRMVQRVIMIAIVVFMLLILLGVLSRTRSTNLG